MRLAALLVPGILLLSTGLALAEDLPEGTFTSTKDGCTKLQSKSLSQLGEDADFTILTKKGIAGYQQACDFVVVTPHNGTSWLATAFCDEGGYTYPDLVSIQKQKDGSLNVTRITDLTQSSTDSSSDSDSSSDDQSSDAEAKKPAAGAAGTPSASTNDNDSDEAFNTYVPCPNAKQ